MIKILISNELRVEGLNPQQIKAWQKGLTLVNPMFHKLMRMQGFISRAYMGVKKEYKYYRLQDDNTIIIPRGSKERLMGWLISEGIPFAYEEDLVEVNNIDIPCKITLRDYQVPLVKKALRSKEGLVVMGTGTGKTVVGTYMLCALGHITTIVCHTTAIATQWRDEIYKATGIEPCVIDAGSKEIGYINIATIQSLGRDKELLEKLAKETGVLMIDEVHLYVSDKRLAVLKHFRPQYIYGFTGTCKRDKDDGRTDAIFFNYGRKLCEYYSDTLTPTVYVCKSDVQIMVDDYAAMIEKLVADWDRNDLIRNIAIKEVLMGRKVLVLTKRVAHGAKLWYKIPENWKNNSAFLIQSTDKERDALLAQFKRSERDFALIIGTTALLSTGVDVPALDTLILACDMKSEVLTEQSVGRILRLFKGKEDPKIIDIVDNKNPILMRQFKERRKFYESKEWPLLQYNLNSALTI